MAVKSSGGGRSGRGGGGGGSQTAVAGGRAATGGDPGLVSAISNNTFSLDNSVRNTLRGKTPRDVAINRFTGRSNVGAATKAANEAFRNASYEIGARRALGQATPSLGSVRSNIGKMFGVPTSQISVP